MTTAKRPYSVFEAWAPETPTVAQRPSWLARKGVSTRPPSPPSTPPRPPALPSLDDGPTAAGERESAIVEKAQPSAPPPTPGNDHAPGKPETCRPVDLGLSATLARLQEENAALRAQVAEMAAAMSRLRREVLEASEPELVRLALTIAERVIGQELSDRATLVVEWARESIDALASKDEVVIALARDVAQQIPPDAWDAIEAPHRVVTDAQLAARTIEIRTAEAVVAEGLPARLGAVAEALGLGDS